MKKVLSVILSITIIFTMLCMCVNAGNGELKITVSADTHLQSQLDADPLDSGAELTYTKGLVNPEMYFHATTQGQMNYESVAIIKAMLKAFVASDSEYLLIAGDLTNGKRSSHLEMAELLKKAEQDSGKEIFVINGNHDCAAESSEKLISMDEFKSIYADFGYNEADTLHKDSASYTVNLNSEYRLIAIDSCIYGKDDGEINDSVLEWIKAESARAKADGVHLVGMMHHSILPHFSVQPMIDDYMPLANAFADLGLKFMFTGHVHANDISSAVSENKNTIYDVQTGSLITSPNAFRNVTFGGDKVEFKSEYVTKIDIADLPDGFTTQQLELISTDFPKYAAEFYEAGICRWLNRYVGSAGKVGKMMKLEPDSFLYGVLDKLMLNIGDALATPIYNDGSTPDKADSIEELAKSMGVEVPESDYTMIYQVAAKVMGAFFHGDEDTVLEGGEWDLLLVCIKSALAQSLTGIVWNNIFAGTYDKAVSAVFGISYEKLTFNTLLKINYTLPLVDRLVEAILAPLTEGLTSDLSAPADINVTLDGYGTATAQTDTLPLTMFAKVIDFLAKFVKTFIGK